MSVEAISWALAQPIKHSTAKFVLVVLANCADGRHFLAWPSTAYLAETTGQDRKTVLENLKRLREMGYIEDTGERKGGTGQVIVYRLKSPETGTVFATNLGNADDENNPEIGTVKRSQKRNSLKSETVPFFPSNSPNFPAKQSQFSHETVPKSGHGTVMEPSLNRQGKEISLFEQSSSRATNGMSPEEKRDDIRTEKKLAREVEIAVLLRANGARKAHSNIPTIACEWAKDPKVTNEILLTALGAAKDAKPGEDIPVNYLKPIVAQLLNPPEPKAPKEPQDVWWTSNEGIDRKGRELGIQPGRLSYPEYKAKIFDEIRKRGGKAA